MDELPPVWAEALTDPLSLDALDYRRLVLHLDDFNALDKILRWCGATGGHELNRERCQRVIAVCGQVEFKWQSFRVKMLLTLMLWALDRPGEALVVGLAARSERPADHMAVVLTEAIVLGVTWQDFESMYRASAS